MSETLRQKKEGGITLIEILISITIITMLATIALTVLSNYRKTRNLDAAVESVYAAFSKAYFDTISSRGDTTYGVHLSTSSATIFPGSVYVDGSAANISYQLPPQIEITNITLSGGGSDVLFSRLTGTTSQSGTFDVRSTSETSLRRTLNVMGTGAVTQ